MILALFLAAIVIAQAGQVAVTAVARDTKPASERIVFSGVLTFPGFDARLGTLTSVDVALIAHATLTWEVTQPEIVKFTVYEMKGVLSFLGGRLLSDDQLDLEPRSPCAPCPRVVTDLGRSGVTMRGTVTPDGEFSVVNGPIFPLVKASLPWSGFARKEISLPVSLEVSTQTKNIIGRLAGEQKVYWNLAVTYNYN